MHLEMLTMIKPALLRTSREFLDTGIIRSIGLQKFFAKPGTNSTSIYREQYSVNQKSFSLITKRQYSSTACNPVYKFRTNFDPSFTGEAIYKTDHKESIKKTRGESEFWRRKMRTLHMILDVNKDGVISFDDFNLLAVRFTNLGNLTPETSTEFLEIMKQTWEEQWGEINPYNLITAEQFLSVLHDKLNDEDQIRKIHRFLPYIFRAVDTGHTGYLDLKQYKLFFRCLGLSNEDAAISFAAIDKNGDGRLSLNEFVYQGRQFFLIENEQNISKMFWGPLATN